MSFALRITAGGALMLEAVTLAWATVLLVGLLRAMTPQDLFSLEATQRVRLLARVLLVGGVGVGLMNTIAVAYLTVNAGPVSSADRTEFLGANYSDLTIGMPQWPLLLIVSGLVALALTSVFRAGRQLTVGVDGVI